MRVRSCLRCVIDISTGQQVEFPLESTPSILFGDKGYDRNYQIKELCAGKGVMLHVPSGFHGLGKKRVPDRVDEYNGSSMKCWSNLLHLIESLGVEILGAPP